MCISLPKANPPLPPFCKGGRRIAGVVFPPLKKGGRGDLNLWFAPPSSLERGASLIELIMFVVIIGIALAGILLVLNQTTAHSADTLMRKQALTVAESLLEEIESRPFSGVASAVTQTNRPNSHSIFDYNGFATSGVFPADGTLTVIPGLGNYNVVAGVAVLPSAWGTIPAASAAQITVTVTDPAGITYDVTGYRTAY